MFKIIDGQGTGKTKKLMEYAKSNSAIFVCANAIGMEQKAHAYGIEGIKFMSYKEFFTTFDPDIHDYVRDEIDNFVSEISQGPSFIGYTLTNEN